MMPITENCLRSALAVFVCATAMSAALLDVAAELPGQLFPLTSVRLLDGPFADAVKVNRAYLLAHDPDRLLAPFLREAGLELKARPYGNWESSGLDGHTAGHYFSALATMIASGADTPEGELRRRLDYMVTELDRCQKASANGYVGGIPGNREVWKALASGRVEAVNGKVEHGFTGDGVQTGEFQDRRWRHGRSFQYTLDLRGEKDADLAVT